MYLLNEQEIFAKWAPILESEVGITERNRVEWMAKYCHYHELYESNSYSVLGAVNGMGATRFPGDPGTQDAFYGADKGSGDKAHTLLPLAMQVAAQTVGLDLVPVVPMPGPMGVLTYLDFVYAGGKTGGTSTGNNIPLMVRATWSDYTNVPAFVAGGTSAVVNGISFGFIGQSRIDGMPIFHVRQSTSAGMTGGTILSNLNTILGAAGIGGVTGAAATNIELVKALEDHITGFSGKALLENDYTGFDINDPYSRADGEGTMDNIMNLSLFNKSVEAKTFQVAAAVTREQVQDLKQFGVDAVSQVESVLINELTQSINKNILDRLFFLGERNHEFVLRTQGQNFFLNLGASAITVGASCSNATNFGAYIQSTALRTQVVQATEVANSASENLHTRQRKIMSKILAIANLIAIRGRRGPATFVVTNGQVCSALQDVAGFIPAPMANTINQMSGSLYPIGTLAGLAIYNDPNRAWNDTRFCVGRKGDGNSPGLVFMPYLMAESVQTIAEGTMAPKVAVKSRYALVEAGFHPETMYLTSGVNLQQELGSLV
jgi:hypothetical protein